MIQNSHTDCLQADQPKLANSLPLSRFWRQRGITKGSQCAGLMPPACKNHDKYFE